MPTMHRPHLLSLAEWAAFFHLDPYHFFGFCSCQDPGKVTVGKCSCNCGDTWREFASFGTDYVTREAVSKAIAEAEQLLLKYLHFAVAPRAFVEQKVTYPEGYWIAKNLDYRNAIIKHKHVQEFGTFTDTLIGSTTITTTVPIVYREQVSTATIVVPSGTTADQLHVYFVAADRFNQAKDKWEIKPASISVSGLIATIEIASYLLAVPSETHLDPDARCLDPDDLTNYITDIEIYRRAVDSCDQGYAVGRFEDCPNPPCQRNTQDVCYNLEKADLGTARVIPVSSCANNTFTRFNCSPQVGYIKEAYANYIAGYPLEDGHMAEPMLEAVCYLSASLLTCSFPYCDCKPCYYQKVHELREIPKVKVGEGQEGLGGDVYKVLLDKLKPTGYPLGMELGALKAQRAVMEYKIW